MFRVQNAKKIHQKTGEGLIVSESVSQRMRVKNNIGMRDSPVVMRDDLIYSGAYACVQSAVNSHHGFSKEKFVKTANL